MRRVFYLLILLCLSIAAVIVILPVLAFMFGLGAVVGLLVFLRRFCTKPYQDLSHPVDHVRE